uniref:Cyclic nucleotide-binding domain-containing protein n=1 Tax=Macrostomum lignano TaxID=282301 RepID=A0A1I8FBK6_9PLAT
HSAAERARTAGLRAGQLIVQHQRMEFDDLSHWQAAMFIKQHQSDVLRSLFKQFMDEPEAEDIYQNQLLPNPVGSQLTQNLCAGACRSCVEATRRQPAGQLAADSDARQVDVAAVGGSGDQLSLPMSDQQRRSPNDKGPECHLRGGVVSVLYSDSPPAARPRWAARSQSEDQGQLYENLGKLAKRSLSRSRRLPLRAAQHRNNNRLALRQSDGLRRCRLCPTAEPQTVSSGCPVTKFGRQCKRQVLAALAAQRENLSLKTIDCKSFLLLSALKQQQLPSRCSIGIAERPDRVLLLQGIRTSNRWPDASEIAGRLSSGQCRGQAYRQRAAGFRLDGTGKRLRQRRLLFWSCDITACRPEPLANSVFSTTASLASAGSGIEAREPRQLLATAHNDAPDCD